MNMMPAPKRNSFLALVYIGLSMEGYFETKGVPVKFKNPLSRDEFTRLYGSTIRGLFNQLWGTNLDVITEARVFEAMRGFDQNILDQVQRNIEVFGNTVYKPGMAQVIGKGGDKMIEAINNISDASMFFDITHPSVTNWLNNHTAEKIVGKLFETQGAAIKSVIRMSVDQKLGFLQTKEMLKSGMILTERQTGWVRNRYNKAYDRYFKRYSLDGMPNAAGRARDAASRSAARWRKHLLDNRTETITRTELTRAHNVAERAGLMQAEENGYIKNVRRTWRRTSSINNHESSLTNDGVTVGLRERFPSGAEFPDEINEQCILENSFETIKKPGRPGKPIGQIPGVGKPKPKLKPKPTAPVIPEFTPANTIKEATEFARKELGIAKVDFKKISLDKANTINEVIHGYMQKYPKLKKKLKFIGDMKSYSNYSSSKNHFREALELIDTAENGRAWALYGGDSKGIGFFSKSLSKETMAEINLIVTKNFKSGWMSFGGPKSLAGIVHHEFTHFMDDIFKISGNAKIKGYWNGASTFQIENGLGKYATTNINEFISEAWAEYSISENPRKIAREVGQIIEEILEGAK
jgi:hypothetical protein